MDASIARVLFYYEDVTAACFVTDSMEDVRKAINTRMLNAGSIKPLMAEGDMTDSRWLTLSLEVSMAVLNISKM